MEKYLSLVTEQEDLLNEQSLDLCLEGLNLLILSLEVSPTWTVSEERTLFQINQLLSLIRPSSSGDQYTSLRKRTFALGDRFSFQERG